MAPADCGRTLGISSVKFVALPGGEDQRLRTELQIAMAVFFTI